MFLDLWQTKEIDDELLCGADTTSTIKNKIKMHCGFRSRIDANGRQKDDERTMTEEQEKERKRKNNNSVTTW